MLEEHCIRYCSPTLASLKTGSIFSCPYTSKENLLPIIRTLNKKVQHKGLRVIPLRYGKKQAIIYVYRPNQLEEDLKQPIAHTLLQKCGYCCKKSNCCIQQLVLRLKDYKDFPHEIGLFLGYPPEDVKGFIDNKKETYCGFWKVYTNPEKAKRLFGQYKKCSEIYMKLWNNGASLEQLTVAI